MFESHPFSIATSPLSPSGNGIELYIQSQGARTWTGELHSTAMLAGRVAQHRFEQQKGERKQPKQVMHMLALVEGPYGGINMYKEVDQESVLLVAGGSGMSFVMGVLDGVVERKRKEGKGGKIEVVWAVRDLG